MHPTYSSCLYMVAVQSSLLIAAIWHSCCVSVGNTLHKNPADEAGNLSLVVPEISRVIYYLTVVILCSTLHAHSQDNLKIDALKNSWMRQAVHKA